jgi:hypothetical protein
MRDAADDVRGRVPERASDAGVPDPEALAVAARERGELDLTSVLALVEQLPRPLSAAMLIDFLATFTEPRD